MIWFILWSWSTSVEKIRNGIRQPKVNQLYNFVAQIGNKRSWEARYFTFQSCGVMTYLLVTCLIRNFSDSDNPLVLYSPCLLQQPMMTPMPKIVPKRTPVIVRIFLSNIFDILANYCDHASCEKYSDPENVCSHFVQLNVYELGTIQIAFYILKSLI